MLSKFASRRTARNLVAAVLVCALSACQSALLPSGNDALLSSLAPERPAVENKGSEMLARLAATEAPRILASFGGAYKDRGTERLLAGIVAPIGSPETGRVASATEASFRSLTPDERAVLKPLRVHIVTAQPGDTPQSMTRRMQGVEIRKSFSASSMAYPSRVGSHRASASR